MKAGWVLFFGFSFFGMLIGLITGITSAAVTSSVMTALFAFMGGKVFLKVDSKSAEVQINMGLILAGFGLFCALGLLGGIYIKVNQKLNNHPFVAGDGKTGNAAGKSGQEYPDYLRSKKVTDSVAWLYHHQDITADSALTILFDRK